MAKSSPEQLQANWSEAKSHIVNAADKAGIDPALLAKIAYFESGHSFNAHARPISSNPAKNTVRQFDGVMALSSAYGYGQFIDSTWHSMVKQHGEKYGVSGAGHMTRHEANAPQLRNDKALQAGMLAEFTKHNLEIANRLGGPNPDANVYAMHNLGEAGGKKFLHALHDHPDMPVGKVLPADVIEKNAALYAHGSVTVSQAYAKMAAAMQEGERYAQQVRGVHHQGVSPQSELHGREAAAIHRSAPPAHHHGITPHAPLHHDQLVQLQRNMNTLGHHGKDGHPLKTDGLWGPQTEHAVRSFQQAHHLQVDGVAGPHTQKALHAAMQPHERTAPHHTEHHPAAPAPRHSSVMDTLRHAIHATGLDHSIEKIGQLAHKVERACHDLTNDHKANVTAALVERSAKAKLPLADIDDVQRQDFNGKQLVNAMNHDHSKVATADMARAVHTPAQESLQQAAQHQQPAHSQPAPAHRMTA